ARFTADIEAQVAQVHTAADRVGVSIGEIGKVIVGGAPEIPGATLLDKMNRINAGDDGLRRFVTAEPRAHVAMSVNLLVPPCRPDADAGFIVLQAD
ncbi:proline racemase family protein, partial [Acinetobacter baumannii]